MVNYEKEVSQFIQDPEDYLKQSTKNVKKMSYARKVSVGIKSFLVGTGVGLSVYGLSVLTGSNHCVAGSTAVVTGLTVGSANVLCEAHNHGVVNRGLDFAEKIKSEINKKLN